MRWSVFGSRISLSDHQFVSDRSDRIDRFDRFGYCNLHAEALIVGLSDRPDQLFVLIGFDLLLFLSSIHRWLTRLLRIAVSGLYQSLIDRRVPLIFSYHLIVLFLLFDYLFISLPIGSLSLGFYVYIGITLSLSVIYHSFCLFSIRNIV